MHPQSGSHLSWFGIFRLGLVQTALGAIVVLTTSTLNRVMVVELALAAMLPGALVTLHHAMQLLRPRMGYGSDVGQRRTPWIVGGMLALALGGAGAAVATTVMAESFALGLGLAIVAYTLIGGGVSATGTSLLVLMAKRVAPERRPAAATMVWMMMILGFALTAGITGGLLEPYSHGRLVTVTAGVSAIAMLITLVAMFRLEGDAPDPATGAETHAKPAFRDALRQVWGEPDARRFTVFVFVSMLAYSAQDLILEPYAGAVFGFTPGESTKLAGVQHGGAFLGMALVALVTQAFKGTPLASLKAWVLGGCMASGLAQLGLVAGGVVGLGWPLRANVFLLGMANGAFAIAAIAGMMALAGEGRGRREGTRMGLWGASQAIAMGAGGFLGTVLVDAAGFVFGEGETALPYMIVFFLEALGFFVAQALAGKTRFPQSSEREPELSPTLVADATFADAAE
ncbi:MAG: BCD family MFS transporter [Myxococcota bacterium]